MAVEPEAMDTGECKDVMSSLFCLTCENQACFKRIVQDGGSEAAPGDQSKQSLQTLIDELWY